MNLQRFGRQVYNRRIELGLTQQDVADLGGPTDTTLGKIENGDWNPGNRQVTLRKLDAGLSWEPGSAKRALDGGYPTPLPTTPEDLYQQVAALQIDVNTLQEEQRSAPEDFSAAKASELDAMVNRLNVARFKLADTEHRRRREVEDARARQLVALWVLAHRLSNPEALGTSQLADAAVTLARQVAAFAESEVGGYSRMQELRRAHARANEHKEDGDAVEDRTSAGASGEARQGQEVSGVEFGEGEDVAAAIQRDVMQGIENHPRFSAVPGVGGGGGEGDAQSGHKTVG